MHDYKTPTDIICGFSHQKCNCRPKRTLLMRRVSICIRAVWNDREFMYRYDLHTATTRKNADKPPAPCGRRFFSSLSCAPASAVCRLRVIVPHIFGRNLRSKKRQMLTVVCSFGNMHDHHVVASDRWRSSGRRIVRASVFALECVSVTNCFDMIRVLHALPSAHNTLTHTNTCCKRTRAIDCK